MLELPESYSFSEQMQKELAGKEITDAVFNKWPHKFTFYHGDYEVYKDILVGRKADNIYPVAGNIEIALGDVRLLLGEGLNIRYEKDKSKVPLKHQMYLEFSDSSILTGNTQMYGAVSCFKEGEYDNFYYKVGKEKPSPYTDAFDFSYFCSLQEGCKKTMSAKAFLATEQRIPGLGNGTLQDILYHARLHPKKKTSGLGEAEWKKLFEAVKETLLEMKEKGGRDTEKDIYGNKGGYQTVFSKNTQDEPCPSCGGWITKKNYLGGSVYFCPVCQPE